MDRKQEVYAQLGVSATKEEVHSAIKNESKGLYPNAFCKILQDPFDPNYAMVIHADGAGTKSLLAYLYYKETGDPKSFRNPAQDSMVMNLDDMGCIGAVNNIVMSNSIDRNAHRVGGDAIEQIIAGYNDFTKKLAMHGVNVISGGGETADVGDLVATATVNSTFFTRLPKDKLITFDKVAAGDVIVGLASAGQASYEDKENSGIGSNGLTAARHVLLKREYAEKYPEIQSSSVKNIGYAGQFGLDDQLKGSSLSIGEALMSPTRTYLPILKDLIDNNLGAIHGVVHNSGGGLTKSMKYGDKLHYVKNDLFQTPAIFKAIQESGQMDLAEMFKVFNMGHRMEIYTTEQQAGQVIDIASKYGVDAKIIGHIERSKDSSNHITVQSGGKDYSY